MTIVRGASKEDDDISWLPAVSQREKKTRVCKGARYVWELRCYMGLTYSSIRQQRLQPGSSG